MYYYNVANDNYNSYYNELIRDIEEYIVDEATDSLYYENLAKMAKTEQERAIILEFSADEKRHSNELRMAYKMLTGRNFKMPQINTPNIPEYKTALKQRILAETKDYKKYGEKYLNAPNKYLKDLFFMLRTDEAIHAMRIPILLTS